MRMRKEVFILSLDDILPNRFQPRIKFNEEAILELAESIKKHGVIQPIIVRKIADKYEIIAGERRYKASLLAGRKTIPAIITDVDDKESAEIALIENVQRQDMTPIEEAISYKKILDMGYLNQSDLAQKLGKTQSTIANKLRLLNLNDDVQEALLEERISERHARSLLRLEKSKQPEVLNRIIKERLTVRKTDQVINQILSRNNSDSSDEQKIQEEKPQIEILNFEEEKGDIMNNNQNNSFNINNNFNMPTEPIIENTQSQVESVQTQINPGFMDIDKIQQQAQDINFSQIGIKEPEKQPFNPFQTGVQEKMEENIINSNPFGTFEPIQNNNIEKPEENVQPEENLQPEINPSLQPIENTQPELSPINLNNSVEMNIFDNNSFNQIEKPEVEQNKFFGMFNEPVEETPQQNIFETPIQNNIEQPVVENIQPEINLIQTQVETVQPEENTQVDLSPINLNDEVAIHTVEEPKFNPFSAPQTTINEEIIQPINTYSLNDNQQFMNNLNNVGNIDYDNLPETKELQPLMEQPKVEQNVKVDFKTVISTVRNCTSQIEQMGYEVDSEELDFEDRYQIIITVNK